MMTSSARLSLLMQAMSATQLLYIWRLARMSDGEFLTEQLESEDQPAEEVPPAGCCVWGRWRVVCTNSRRF